MDGSYMPDSRPKKVHEFLAIDPHDVAAVCSAITDGDGCCGVVLFRNGLTFKISGDSADSLIDELDALYRAES